MVDLGNFVKHLKLTEEVQNLSRTLKPEFLESIYIPFVFRIRSKVKMDLNIDSIDDDRHTENMEYYSLYFYQIL